MEPEINVCQEGISQRSILKLLRIQFFESFEKAVLLNRRKLIMQAGRANLFPIVYL